ncbi:MAG: 3-coathanger stack domain-containing protein [Bacteroidota bacterium]
MRSKIYSFLFLLHLIIQFSWAQNPNWSVENQNSYTYTMSMVSSIQDDCLPSNFEGSQIAVFDTDEVCRGVANLISTSQGYRAFLTVFSNEVIDELFFRVYDGVDEQVYFSHINKLNFIAESIQGSISSPINIFYDSESEVDAGDDQTIDGSSFATLDASSTQGGTWIIHYGEGGSFENAADRNTKFYGQAGGTYMLIWLVADNNCLNEMDHVFITFVSTGDGLCPITMTFDETVVIDTNMTINAADSIISQADIEAIATADYRAGKVIILKTGFHAKMGSNFHAKLENCIMAEVQLMEDRASMADIPRTPFSSLKVIPNPTYGDTQVWYFIQQKGEVQFQLYDSSGQIVRTINEVGFADWNSIDISLYEIPKGLYYLRFQDKAKVTIEKLIVH